MASAGDTRISSLGPPNLESLSMAPSSSETDIIASLRSIDASTFTSQSERRRAIQEAQTLISRLETPFETSTRLNVGYPATLASIQTALDLRLFHSWLVKHDGKPCSAEQLQHLVPQCDPSLFLRLLRHLVSSNVIWQHNKDSTTTLYEMTPFIRGQVDNDLASQLECTFLWAMSMMMSLPEFFKKTEYNDPQKAAIDPVKSYTGGLSIWEYLKANEGWSNVFGRLMRASSASRGDITELIQDQKIGGDEENSALIVDIGGSHGRDLISFREGFKTVPGRLVLQDLPHVISAAPNLDEWNIEKMPYDFFTPQPVIGAKAYLLHNIIHDWPDNRAEQILRTVATAMDPVKSRLFIIDSVIQEGHPLLNETGMDWLMMIYGNGMESKYCGNAT